MPSPIVQLGQSSNNPRVIPVLVVVVCGGQTKEAIEEGRRRRVQVNSGAEEMP